MILVLFLSVFSFKSLLGPGYFPMHDDLQIGRLYQMDLCIKDGQIPCRWVPDMGFGYGYPLFNYYPPFPYYAAEIFHLVGFSLIDSIKILFILGLVFSGIFAYLLGSQLWGKYGGLVVAVFYIYAPYHAVDVYVRGALNEFWGLVFFPAIFWVVYKIIKEEKKIYVATLALFFALLLLSHNLMAFFFAPAVAAWGIFLLWYLKKPWKILIQPALGGIWGVGLAAFFTLPVIFEQKFVHVETMFIGYFNYLAHFATINQLFFSRFWGYGPSVWGTEDGMPFPIGHLHWIIATISLIIFTFLWFKKKITIHYYLLFTIYYLLFLGTAFLAHQRSTFVWQAVPFLASMQFPWRFVGISSFFATILAGSIFVLIKTENKATILAVLMVLAVVGLNYSFFQPEKILNITDEEKLFSAKGWYKLQTDAIFDYLPIYAEKPPGEKAPDQPWFEEGKGEIKNFKKGTNWQKFEANVDSDKATIRLPLYDFPGMRVWVDGNEVKINHDNFLGLITFQVPPGTHQFSARLTNTPVRTVSNLISLISWLEIVGFMIKCKYGRIDKRTGN